MIQGSTIHQRRHEHRHTCKCCGQRRALAHYRHGWAARADHDLCRQCWQAWLDRSWQQARFGGNPFKLLESLPQADLAA